MDFTVLTDDKMTRIRGMFSDMIKTILQLYMLILTLIVGFITYNCFIIQANIGPVWGYL